VSEAPDPAGRQVPEDHEPAVEGWEGQHDVTDTGLYECVCVDVCVICA